MRNEHSGKYMPSRRVAQAVLELCGSPERRDLGTCRACGVSHIDAVEIEVA
jgi:hypothetical protein